MSEKTTFRPGTPCWIDLGTPDQDGAGEFYGRLFGWQLHEEGNAEDTGGYRTAEIDGRAVGGVMQVSEEEQPPAWLTYFATDDADATAAAAREAGGDVLHEPMTVLEHGRMAVLADPGGAAFGIWQAGTHPGFGIVKEAGAVNWTELNTRDPGASKEFYGSLFGWSFEDQKFEGAGTYTAITLGEETFGGMLDITDRVPAEVPAHWLVYFTVDDAEATISAAGEGGGETRFGPQAIPRVGNLAVIKDPFGAVFAVIQPDPELTV
jgi:predicted enzyme related to lactoylglutathione lyase